MRVLLGGLAAAAALTLVPSASATHSCAEGFETVCTVTHLVQNALCHPKYNPC